MTPPATRAVFRTYPAGRSTRRGTKIHAMVPRNRYETDVFVPLCGAPFIRVGEDVYYDDQTRNACLRCWSLRRTEVELRPLTS